MTVRQPEILAPVGDMDMLSAALRAGADAVFFGSGDFHARNKAVGLPEDKLPEIIEEIHFNSARCYLTLNTLIRQNELTAAIDLALAAYEAGIDAIIIQDIGLADILHRHLPALTLHASTQMAIYTPEAMKLAAELGMKRIVLPREYNLAEIRSQTALAHQLGMETEVFVHGALCVCYSGHCHLSRHLGGRSANRGACAQPCRMNYTVEGHGSLGLPLLSPKDISYLDNLSDLAAAGVDSFKIEGRMRSPEYVATAVNVFKRQLYGQTVSEQNRSDLLLAFNRGGSFSTSRLTGQRGRDFLSGDYAGNYGIELGRISAARPSDGTLTIKKLTETADGMMVPELRRGDVISIRLPGEGELASAPLGEVRHCGNNVIVKGFHPAVLRKLPFDAPVFLMRSEELNTRCLALHRPARPVRLVLSEKAPHQYTLKIEIVKEVEHKDSVKQEIIDQQENIVDQENNAHRQDIAPDTGEPNISPGASAEVQYQSETNTTEIKPLPYERIKQQLSKLGNTGLKATEIVIYGEIELRVAELNEIRRRAVAILLKNIQAKTALTPEVPQAIRQSIAEEIQNLSEYSAKNGSVHGMHGITSGSKWLSLPGWRSGDKLPDETGAEGFILPLAALLRSTHQSLQKLFADYKIRVMVPAGARLALLAKGSKAYPEWRRLGLQGQVTAGAKLAALPDDDWWLWCDGNIANTATLNFFRRRGCRAFAPAGELGSTAEPAWQALVGAASPDLAALVLSGAEEAMLFEHCPIGFGQTGCQKCRRERLFILRDQRGRRLPFLPLPEQHCSGRLYAPLDESPARNLPCASQRITSDMQFPEFGQVHTDEKTKLAQMPKTKLIEVITMLPPLKRPAGTR